MRAGSTLPRAIIFDLDGTLADTDGAHYAALRDAIAALKGTPPTRGFHDRMLKGMTTEQKVSSLVTLGHIDAAVADEVLVEKRRRTAHELARVCQPREDLSEALAFLTGRGIVIGVCSNSREDSVVAALGYLRLASHVTAVASAGRLPPKPAPDLYLHAMHLLGVTPLECFAYEDAAPGIAAARASGLWVSTVQSPHEITKGRLVMDFCRWETERAGLLNREP